MKTITKRDFCHNVTTHLKKGEDLLITGRNFEATLKFIKGGYMYKETIDLGLGAKYKKKAKEITGNHAENCPCVMCRPPKKKSA